MPVLYGRETWPLTLRDEHRPRVFKNVFRTWCHVFSSADTTSSDKFAHLLPKYKSNTLLPPYGYTASQPTRPQPQITEELNNTCQEAVVAYSKVHVL